MHRVLFALLSILVMEAHNVHAGDFLLHDVPDAKIVGKTRLSYMVWDVYDVSLYAPQAHWKPNRPFALKFKYLRNITGKKIADRSVKEMRAQGYGDEVTLASWYTQMKNIFPNVHKGTELTGVYTENAETVFFAQGAEIGRIKDPQFGAAFFNIWLGDKTTVPKIRQQLLGAR